MIDPCGTPLLISHHQLKYELIFVRCFRLVRYSIMIGDRFISRKILIGLLVTHVVYNYKI